MNSTGITSFTAPRVEPEMLEKEIQSLSKSERKAVHRDLYGTNSPTDEDPRVIEQKLKKLESKLRSVPNESKQAFLKAQELCPGLANDPYFRLRFLRADYYDVEKAMQRTLKYWALKDEVFGPDRAYHKAMTLDDFDDNDMMTKRSQGFWVGQHRDHAGRAIAFSRKPQWKYKHRNNLLRWIWYVLEQALKDPKVQRNGMVLMAIDDGPFTLQQFDRKLESRFYHLLGECLPLRWTAIHHFYDSKVHSYVNPFILFMMGPKMRARYRVYHGAKRHTRLAALEELGLTKEILPPVLGGKDDTLNWIEEERRQNEDRKAAQ